MKQLTTILYVTLNPIDQKRQRLETEYQRINNLVSTTKYGDQIKIKPILSYRKNDLIPQILKYNPQILHFSSKSNIEPYSFLENGLLKKNIEEDLYDVLEMFQDVIRVTVFTSCTSDFAKKVSKIIDCSIGIHGKINNNDAIVFSSAFYRAIGSGNSIMSSFEQGLFELRQFSNQEKNIPKIYFGKEKEDFCLLNINSNFFKKTSALAYTRSKNTPLYILPSVPVPFYGRNTQITLIKKILAQKGVVLLTGLAGVGKTALASIISHSFRADETFSGGVIWLDVRDSETAIEVYQKILREFDMPNIYELDKSFINKFLSNNELLIILDNADKIPFSEINKLVKSRAYSSLLITSRNNNIATNDIFMINLLPLENNEAYKFISDRLIKGYEISSIKKICNLLGNLPLALKNAVQVILYNDYSIDEYIELLQENRFVHLSKVEKAFNVSLQIISNFSMDVLEYICLFYKGEFDLRAIEFCMDVSDGEEDLIKNSMRELLSLSIISKMDRQNWFSIHPLWQEYIKKKVDSSLLNIKMEKLVIYYLNLVEEYGGFQKFYKWPRLENEIGNIIPIIDWCFKNKKIDQYVAFNHRLTHFLLVRGFETEDHKHEQQLIKLVKNYRNNLDLLWCLMHRVLRMIIQNRYEDAISVMNLLEPLFIDNKDIGGVAHIQRNYGEMEESKGNFLKAEEHYKNVLKIVSKLPNVTSSVIPFNNRFDRVLITLVKIGRVNRLMGNLEEAEKYFNATLKIGIRLDRFTENQSTLFLYELGNLEYDRGNYKKAEELYLQSIEKPNKEKYLRFIAYSKKGLGKTKNKLEEIEAARSYLKEALAIFQRIGDINNITEVTKILSSL